MRHLLILSSALFPGFLWLFPISSHAIENTLCAEVKIEIHQEMTLERQAFDAHMRINNGLTHITLSDVDVDIVFTNEEGNSTNSSLHP